MKHQKTYSTSDIRWVQFDFQLTAYWTILCIIYSLIWTIYLKHLLLTTFALLQLKY